MGGKNPRNNFSRNNQIVPAKKCWDNNRRKKLRKKFFSYSHDIMSKKWGEKTRETIFPETQQIVREKM